MFTLFSASAPTAASLGADPMTILLLALVLDGYLGEMGPLFRLIPHPVVIMGKVIAHYDRRLNRPDRSSLARRIRGVVTAGTLVVNAALLGVAIQACSVFLPLGWLLELFLATTLIAQRSLFDHVAAVVRGLETGGVEGGREAVRHIVGRDPAQLDRPGVGRAAVESLAENFSDAVVAPVFWYLLFGMPGLLAYKMANTLDSMIGHKTEQYRDFGWAAARFDDLVNLIPARLSGLLIAAAAIAPKWADARAALRCMGRDAGKHRSPNAGWPEAAMAGALGLRLSGPRNYRGEAPREEPWIGDGRADVADKDIRRALVIFRDACLIQGGIVALIALATTLSRFP
jgi:adenosylcobinamide-phosphate synthase